VIVNVNERTFPSKSSEVCAGEARISNIKISSEAGRVELHSSKAKMLARVELKAIPRRGEAAARVQGDGACKPAILPPPAIPMFATGLIGVQMFDKRGRTARERARCRPQRRRDAAEGAGGRGLCGVEPGARAAVDAQLKKIIPEFHEYRTTKSQPYRNHWIGGATTGNYGKDFGCGRRQTSVAFGQYNDEVVYFGASRDADEKPLNGSNSYVCTFPRTAAAVCRRCVLSGDSGQRTRLSRDSQSTQFVSTSTATRRLKNEADGSFENCHRIKSVSGVPDSNWLRRPTANRSPLTFRAVCFPKDVVSAESGGPSR